MQIREKNLGRYTSYQEKVIILSIFFCKINYGSMWHFDILPQDSAQ